MSSESQFVCECSCVCGSCRLKGCDCECHDTTATLKHMRSFCEKYKIGGSSAQTLSKNAIFGLLARTSNPVKMLKAVDAYAKKEEKKKKKAVTKKQSTACDDDG